MSERIRKVNELVQRELGEFFAREGAGKGVFITVTAVETAPDLKTATIWCSVIGLDDELADKMLATKRHPAQKHVNSVLSMKYTPQITLKLDHSGEYASYISKLIDKVK